MKLLHKLRSAFTGGAWSLAWRPLDGGPWRFLEASPVGRWYADPFAVEEGEEHYLFAEVYRKDKNKGCIGYFRFIGGEPVFQGIVLEAACHMSYPDVFKYGDCYYMIPETSAAAAVDLYRADRFPDRWTKEKTLIAGKKYVDPTFYRDKNGCFLLCYAGSGSREIHVYALDMEKKEAALLSRRPDREKTGRPAGPLFCRDGRLLRPAQDCSRKYGEALLIYQVDALNQSGRFLEHRMARIGADALFPDRRPDRVHHLTQDSRYEAVDVFREKIDLLHGPKLLARAGKK